MIISCDGITIGLPSESFKMLFVQSIKIRASACASIERGTCTAIWSPSKSALNAPQANGCNLIALPSTRTGSKA